MQTVLVLLVAFVAGIEGILDEFEFHQPIVACTLIGLVTNHLAEGLLLGGSYSSIVITGIHHSFHAVELELIGNTGFNSLLPIWSMANVAQGGAAFAVYFLAKNKKTKAIALPSAISCLFGVTEAAIFGVNMKYGRPFIGAAIGGALGGAYIVFSKVVFTAVGVTGLPALAISAPGTTLNYLIAMGIAVVGAFIATWILGIKED